MLRHSADDFKVAQCHLALVSVALLAFLLKAAQSGETCIAIHSSENRTCRTFI